MDSPGFSAVKSNYTLMDRDSGTLQSIEHGDQRQIIVATFCDNVSQSCKLI